MNAIVFIPLTQGRVATIDFEDLDKARGHKWYAKRYKQRTYAARNVRGSDGSRNTLFLHTVLMPGAPKVDHRDGEGLNNRRDNLRSATQQQNQRAFRRKSGATSKFRGVSASGPQWRAVIYVDRVQHFLGRFDREEDAARAYDVAARQHFGEFSSPNFP